MIVDQRTRVHLAAVTRFRDIREFAELGSTNSFLAAEARAGAAEGTVVVADYQTAGRGRLGRTWTAPPGGALLMSILLRPAHIPADRRHLVTAAVALAAAQACRSVAGCSPQIKWPNDLLIGDGKLAGILAEAEADAVVVGIGVNVVSAPPGGVSLEAAAGHPVDRGELLAATLEGLEVLYQDPDAVAIAYQEACATVGQRVLVELPGRRLAGLATAVDDRGHLLVRTEAGRMVTVTAGDVVHVRPS